jgi:hypothetical protein
MTVALPDIIGRDEASALGLRLAAIRLALDHLIGKPQISIDAVTAKVDVGALYLEAVKRANEGRGNSARDPEIQ